MNFFVQVVWFVSLFITSSSVFAAPPTMGTTIPTLLLSLILVIVVILVAAAIIKKTNLMANQVQGMKVVTLLPLSTKERLVVVDIEGQQLLLGVTHHQITLLKELDKPLTQNQTSLNTQFINLFQQAKNKQVSHD